ncbi:MAG TPA: DUF126 domain-containing protein [Actinomycetota bacterium]|nr:DUF126 domain-containing protein [Actinomycetota bacterium]
MTRASGTSRTLVPGRARGILLVLDEPLSFWGGLDAATGKIIDPHHPQAGASVSRRVLAMPSGRGSSSSSSVLAEALRAGVGPAAILLGETDAIVALGALVANELYGTECPVAVVKKDVYTSLVAGKQITVAAGAEVTFGASS